MRILILVVLLLTFSTMIHAQSRVFVRNSTWQDFEVEAGQYGTLTMDLNEWSGADPIVRGWLETTGQEVLSVNRSNSAVPEGDTAYFDIGLNGATDHLTIKLRIVGIAGGTELDYSVSGNGFSEPWFDDGDFHEVQATLMGKSVVIKFKPDNDDSNQDRDIRFAIHDLPVYDLPMEDFQNPNVLNVMFYNIQMISFGVSGMPQANDRGNLLPAQISEYQDVVCFAEAFDDVPREDHLIPAMEAAGFSYRTEILNEPGGLIPFPVNGGVIIFSRWPIEVEDEIDYAECGQAASDCLARKGVKYARINKLGKRYHVFGTHMDAGGNADDIYARRTQMAEIRDFISDLNIPENEPVLFGGDFNTDPIGSDMDYQAFVDTMHPIIPKHIGFWESSFSDDFGKIIDHAWGDRRHLVPTEITNEIITIRSLDPVLWDISEFSDHRCVLGRYSYPDFSKSGGDTLVCPGDSISMVIVSEFPATYQWFKDDVEIMGATDSVYNILDAMESESGHYTCLVSYDVVYGNWTDSITPLFFPNGPDTVMARLSFDFGDVVIDQALCELSISDVNELRLNIYPNPTIGVLNISLEDESGNSQLNLFSTRGELVSTQIMRGDNFKMDLSNLNKGVYLLEIIAPNSTVHQRVVVH